MATISESEVEDALKGLKRLKAGGLDGLPNDFYRDVEQHLVSTFTELSNRLLKGERLPDSFKAGLVLPLRKKGEYQNPLDYRPITLLVTSYKVFAMIIATRIQRRMHTIIGSTQQGFVCTRLMEKVSGSHAGYIKTSLQGREDRC